METRPATPGDLAAVAALQARWEMAWFGAPETDQDEVGESFGRTHPLAERSRLIVDEDRVLAAVWWWDTSATVLVDPAVDGTPIYADLLPWLEGQAGPHVEALSRDETLIAALTARGWRHVRSSFELIRPLSQEWTLAEPVWPEGIAVRDVRAEDAPAVHRLIYVDAAWAEVPGHQDRPLAQWRELFMNRETVLEQQALAWRGERAGGVVIGRTFADGTGWISQLAVAKDQRGEGLGRALLLEGLRRRRDGGAKALGLSVQAENRGALSLYLGVGLRIDREWQEFSPPARSARTGDQCAASCQVRPMPTETSSGTSRG